ncbi:hypothetical protein KUTeg_004288 [Tegillarca granosa]|uniref:39S ribosomal protein L12, mitochondrial n=1 Tax=Tegillarca granosa TaxID=220873 RepID=A0ABQ9FT88_TEGGR|nr:hypothetical protein KUTeg_004288 [Tegillarca granosa]
MVELPTKFINKHYCIYKIIAIRNTIIISSSKLDENDMRRWLDKETNKKFALRRKKLSAQFSSAISGLSKSVLKLFLSLIFCKYLNSPFHFLNISKCFPLTKSGTSKPGPSKSLRIELVVHSHGYNRDQRLLPICRTCTTASQTTNADVIPPPLHSEPTTKDYPEKIQKIVSDISQLTLLEVADLNELLKKTLKIQDTPIMAMGMAAAAPAPKEEEEVEEAAAPRGKTSFTVKLIGFDAAKKVVLIKELKGLISGMNLVQAKKFVESAPQNVKEDLGKDEAEELKKAIEAAGGQCEIIKEVCLGLYRTVFLLVMPHSEEMDS